MLAGAGEHALALAVAGCVAFVNLGLRLRARPPLQTTELVRNHAVEILCRGAQQAHLRALRVQGFATSGLHLTALHGGHIGDSDRVAVTARRQMRPEVA